MATGGKNIAECPECGSEIRFRKAPYMGQVIVCGHCETELEVVSLNPVELDWAYESEDFLDDDDWDEDEEEENEYLN